VVRSGRRCRRNTLPIELAIGDFSRIRNGKLVEVLGLLARRLHERGKLKLEEAFVDATFASAKKGASLLARPGAAT
jgi:hypothetical protein